MTRFLISAVYRDEKGQMQEKALGIIHSSDVRNAAASARLKYPLPSHISRKTQPFPEKKDETVPAT